MSSESVPTEYLLDSSDTKKSAKEIALVLKNNYNRPLQEVARIVGMSATSVKKLCRDLGIKRWPHRKLQRIEGEIKKIDESMKDPSKTSFERNQYHERYLELIQLKQQVYDDPNIPLSNPPKKKYYCKSTPNPKPFHQIKFQLNGKTIPISCSAPLSSIVFGPDYLGVIISQQPNITPPDCPCPIPEAESYEISCLPSEDPLQQS
ncbi:hypothetical protein ENUP19_0260G0012 [Entamoeba nuttalli]|uniref:RWP-RK domain-containing protein n=1 Tax=Entamoeba nuttalli TaxID=412467 RepID=A0ABQ0DSB6_9EUKA